MNVIPCCSSSCQKHQVPLSADLPTLCFKKPKTPLPKWIWKLNLVLFKLKKESGFTPLTLHWARLKGAASFLKTKMSLNSSTVATLAIQELRSPVLKQHFDLGTPLRAKWFSISAQTTQGCVLIQLSCCRNRVSPRTQPLSRPGPASTKTKQSTTAHKKKKKANVVKLIIYQSFQLCIH